MKRILIVALAACGLSAVASAASPAAPGPMHERIRQGVQSGALTPAETAAIIQQQAQLRRRVARSRATGAGINPLERARIAANAHQNSQMLYRLRHNGRTR